MSNGGAIRPEIVGKKVAGVPTIPANTSARADTADSHLNQLSFQIVQLSTKDRDELEMTCDIPCKYRISRQSVLRTLIFFTLPAITFGIAYSIFADDSDCTAPTMDTWWSSLHRCRGRSKAFLKSEYAPVIGVFAEADAVGFDSLWSEYSLFVQSEGMHVVPIPTGMEFKQNALRRRSDLVWLTEYAKEIAKYINGVIVPGGNEISALASPIFGDVMQVVQRRIDGGEVVPIFGICGGFEAMAMLYEHGSQSACIQGDKLDYEYNPPEACIVSCKAMDSENLRTDLTRIRSSDVVLEDVVRRGKNVYMDHRCYVKRPPAGMSSTSHSVDRRGKRYISSAVSDRYPFVGGVQFHPEKPKFAFSQWTNGSYMQNVPHSEAAMYVANHFAGKLAGYAKKSSARFPAKLLARAKLDAIASKFEAGPDSVPKYIFDWAFATRCENRSHNDDKKDTFKDKKYDDEKSAKKFDDAKDTMKRGESYSPIGCSPIPGKPRRRRVTSLEAETSEPVIGIEMEVCERSLVEIPGFQRKVDKSIRCTFGTAVEFVYDGLLPISKVGEVVRNVSAFSGMLLPCHPTSCGTHMHISQSMIGAPEFDADDMMKLWLEKQETFIKKYYHVVRPRAPRNVAGDTGSSIFPRGFEPMMHVREKPYPTYPHHFELRGYPCIVSQSLDAFSAYVSEVETMWTAWTSTGQVSR